MRFLLLALPLLTACTVKLDSSNAITGQTYKATISLAPITRATREVVNADGTYTRSTDISYYTVPVVQPCKK